MKWIELEKLSDIELGKTPARKETSYWHGNNVWLSIADLNKKYVYESKEEITDKAISETNIKIVPKNTVVMSFKLSIGKRAITKKALYTNEAIAAFHIKDTDSLFYEYLYYALGYVDLLKYTDKAVKGKTLNKAKLRKIKIPVPPIEIQEQIVEVLDKAQNLIDKRKEQISFLDDLIESIFYEMFGDPVKNEKGWEILCLNNVCDVRDGTHDSPKYISDGYPLITSKNVKDGKLNFNDIKYISEKDFNNINKRSKVDMGDILMPMIGTIGNPTIIDSNNKFAIKNVALIKFFESSKVINIYVKELLKSSYFEKAIRREKRGGTQKFISLGNIRNFEIPVPPLPLQNQFAEKVEAIEKQKATLTESLELMEDNYNSIMQRAFKGELFR